jgi:hypothetical protein
MTTLNKLHPAIDIYTKDDAIESAACLVKLDFSRCGVPDLYGALKRFNKRFSSISQDVTDPVSPLTSNPFIEPLLPSLP